VLAPVDVAKNDRREPASHAVVPVDPDGDGSADFVERGGHCHHGFRWVDAVRYDKLSHDTFTLECSLKKLKLRGGACLVKIAHSTKLSLVNIAHFGLPMCGGFSCRTTSSSEVWTFRLPLYSIKPSWRNLFMKKLTRERVVPIISARVP